MPRVSICVPNLNTRPFLPERFETIFNQTFHDWELIVCDSYSDDGAWEFFQGFKGDPRVRLYQIPREGLYAGWNECLHRAQGEFIYIATSDDTMSPGCLEKLVGALDRHPDCGLAHCCLTFIDENSRPIHSGRCWNSWPTTQFFGEWNQKHHVRPRGHDTVMALGLKTAYYSITQILVRRSLFDEVGMFESQWGPAGDLEWQLRAGLATKTVHVPEYLATWRIHPQQSTQLERHYRAVLEGCYLKMADKVLKFSLVRNLPFPGGLPHRLRRFYWDEYISAHLSAEKTFMGKFRILSESFRLDPSLVIPFLRSRFYSRVLRRSQNYQFEIQKELRRLDLDALSPAKG